MKQPENSPLNSLESSQEIARLSENAFPFQQFPHIEEVIENFHKPEFFQLSFRKRFRQINQTLCDLIQNAPSDAFLLSAILDFFERINKMGVLQQPLDLTTFEFWLNHFSNVSEQQNYVIRAKISGKFIPREEYQVFFPIGMGKIHFGSHFVAAHLSPDVDTMIASFWGWMDAFAARIGSSLHLWCLPGGPPDSVFTSVFQKLIGNGIFSSVARTTSTLNLTAMDLVTQKLFTKELGTTVISNIDHGVNDKAVILVNEQGHYLGDWRSSDVEIVRQIIILFKACLHWFENHLHSHLISLLAKEDLSIKDLSTFISSTFDVRIKDCEPAQDFNEQQQIYLNDFFYKVLKVKKGLEGTFRDLNEGLPNLSIQGMLDFQTEVEKIALSDIFDERGHLKENRPLIFNYLKKLVKQLDDAIFEVRTYVERLDIVLAIKYKVLGMPYTYLTLSSDMDEMGQKMQNHEFLTVIIHEQDGSLFPVGIVRASDLRKHVLGTVSLRDFCNLEEVRMSSHLEVISVVDHHKSSLKTISAPTALIGDAQSCNVLIAEQIFKLNDKYSLGGMSKEEIEKQIKEISSQVKTASEIRILQRLLQKLMIAKRNQQYYIHPRREIAEYLSFLYAILDDTDLLSKASYRDLECVAGLLNRLKSLSLKKEVEIIHFDDLPRDQSFIKVASQRILQQIDMYTLYREIYSLKESEIESHLKLCIEGGHSNIFLDTKEQNRCARVGQTKMFSSNFPFFLNHAQKIRENWLEQSQDVFQKKPEIDLYIHMISTITNAEEVYRNEYGPYKQQDELWFWVPHTQQAYRHLNSFLTNFQYGTKNFQETLSLEFLGSPPEEFIHIFQLHFPSISFKKSLPDFKAPIAILRFKAGAINSRKSMITPYLPKL